MGGEKVRKGGSMDASGIWEWIQQFFVALWAQWQVRFIIGHVVLNVVVAVAATVRTGEFVLGKTPDFLWRKLLPLLAVYAVFQVFGSSIKMDGLGTVVWAAIELMLVNDTQDNLKLLGITFIPEGATKERLEE